MDFICGRTVLQVHSRLRPHARCAIAWYCLAGIGAAMHAQVPTLHVDSKLVQANCTALHKKGLAPAEVPTLGDVHLFEDGREQPIVDLRKAEDVPLLLFILLDVSGSEASNWDVIREQTAVFIEKALKKGDRIAVITFNSKLRVLIDVTDPNASVERLAELVRKMRHDDGKEIVPRNGDAGGGTRLWDSLSIAAQVAARTRDRHAAIVFTDGGENGSVADPEDALSRAQRASLPIYEVENVTGDISSTNSRSFWEGPMKMRDMANKSGGLVLNGDGRRERVAADLDHLAQILRSQFLVEYKPPPGTPPRFHPLKVKAPGRSLDIRCKAEVWH